MPITQHDAIVKAFRDLCLASPALAGGNVDDDSLYDELPEGQTQAIAVSLLDSQPLKRVYDGQDWTTTVRVSCRARDDRFGAEGRPTAQLAAAVYARVMASNKLGGLADVVEAPRISSDLALTRTRAGVLNLDFPVRHRTAIGVLT